MTIEKEVKNENLEIRLTGRLDSATAGELDSLLKAEKLSDYQGLSVNMKKVDYISSKGLRVLVSAYRALEGKPLTLVSPNAPVMEVLRLSGLKDVFKISGED